MNPIGQIPAWVEGDLVLTESLAITNHIARTRGGPLSPRTPAEAALLDQWTLLAVTAIEGPALEIQTITGQGALIGIVRDSAPGETISIVVERAGRRLTLSATLVARPDQG